MPGSHTNPEPSCATHNGTRVLAVQENNQTQCRSNGTVVDCGSAEGKVIGDFGIDAADASGAVVARVQNTKGKKAKAGNANRKFKSVVVQSLEDSNEKYRRGSCGKTFLCRSGELRHRKKCCDTNKFQCFDCNKVFQDGRNLLQHKERKNLANKMKNCDRCEQKFCLDRDLLFHEKQVHNYKRNFKCGLCHRQYVSRSALELHERRIHDPERCICPVCGKRLKNSYGLKRHKDTHKDVNDMECSYCVQCFKSQNSLNQHLRRCHPDEYIKIRLQETNKKKNKRMKVSTVSTHETEISGILKKQMYEKKRSFEYGKCPRRYIYQCSLDKPMKKHGSKKLRTTSEYHKKTLEILEIQIQDKEKPFKCEKCPKGYEYRRSLERHRKVIHEAKVPCTVSERHAGVSETLEKQMHDNEKLFQCEKCSGKYKYKHCLERHAKSHKGDKPHVCEQCNKSFAVAYMLKQHKYSHVTEKTLNVHSVRCW